MDDVMLLIDGEWRKGRGDLIPVVNPATGRTAFHITGASDADLDDALAAVRRGFLQWKGTSAFERSKVLRRAAELLRERADEIARILVTEQGKPLAEAKGEIAFSADTIEWFAEEGRRTYGRVIPSRAANSELIAYREPVGPVAAFVPWNFPILQAVQKLSPAFAAGCSVVLKAPEDTPACCAALAQVFLDAGAPGGLLQLVYGVPSRISEYLIPHPVIRKVSFTGSTQVGKNIAAMAGRYLKRVTLELGGHSPTIVFDDADIDNTIKSIAGVKFRNAGQVCVSPTRILVQDRSYERFIDGFVSATRAIKVGDGLDPSTTMGPLVSQRRLDAIERLVQDAVRHGATVETGGKRIGNEGFFYEPTVMTNVPAGAQAMNEEPFGPIALIAPFKDLDEVLAEANRLDYGLAAYAYTNSSQTIQLLLRSVESGMIAINSQQVSFPEAPFGGMKDSGYGSESGTEAMESYLNTKLVHVTR
ncbi:NAD-dependent succinate-semialdehyde dehydrogenase [Mesorhizobium sp. B3-1-3]|uniref:NAD-dependent succinate-semialdehyde dehydrogenase n=1 Tax=unclassified Mesorhizobium TaxID=325217 RepID=UPI0011286862|nr:MULTISPECIES: NAD-dependent succinate-semialdehyde dehydrogenase [unclassified Mesorhizobium]TPI56068.1 NAD-dependent succinate-semialdehyde dehydrogenase [Mesorhizobium sp. B3-1-8]TPI63362.1 NAD-dependent succinate-semialdehyde dehydrogenase [Mesorhizobium sp. B3-1-3]